MFFVSHLYFDRVKRPSSGWMAVTSITHHYYMITNKFENLHVLQRKINTRALLPDARPSRPILAVKKTTYIQALRLNTVQPIGWTLSINCILTSSRPWYPGPEKCLYKRSSLSLPSKAERKKLGWNAHTRFLVQLWFGVGLELAGLSALDPLSRQEKWRRLAGGRLGIIASYL